MTSLKYKFFILLIFFLSAISIDVYAWKGPHSRGGGRIISTHSSHSSTPKSRSSSLFSSKSSQYNQNRSPSLNIHLLHNQQLSRSLTPQYNSRSEAVEAFQKSEAFKKFSATYTKEPVSRPEYIPTQIRQENQIYPVTFENGIYGYYYYGPEQKKTEFIPLKPNDFVITDRLLRQNYFIYRGISQFSEEEKQTQENIEQSFEENNNGIPEKRTHFGSRIAWFLGFISIFFIIRLIINLLMQAKLDRSNETSNNSSYYKPIISKSEHTSELFHSKSDKNFEQDYEDLDISVSQTIPKSLHSLSKGKVIKLSDRVTLKHFKRPLNFIVTNNIIYRHPTFTIRHIALQNNNEKEPIEVHLFCKEVGDNFALYLGTLDHEGTNTNLKGEKWFHLEKYEDSLSKHFASIFDTENGEKKVVFSQYDFGAFYNIICPGISKCLSLCEYYPEDPPSDLYWQHAIVVWNKDWISCYYCIEINQNELAIH